MTDHDCIQREDISSLKTSMDRINREMFNGDGIIKQIPVLSHQILELTEVVRDLRTVVSGLNKFMDETRGGQKVFKNAVPWIAVTIAAVTLAFSVFRINKVKDEQDRIDQRLEWKQDRTISPATRVLKISTDTLNKEK